MRISTTPSSPRRVGGAGSAGRLAAGLAAGCCLALSWLNFSDHLSGSLAVGAGDEVAAVSSVKSNPFNPEAHNSLARILSSQGRGAEAVDAYRAALSLRPSDPFLWMQFADCLEASGQNGAAESAYRNAVAAAPHYGQTRAKLGEHLLWVGRRDEAFAEFRKAASASPDLAPAITALAVDEFGGDVAAVAAALEPSSEGEWVRLTNAFLAQGKHAAAGEVVARAGQGLGPGARRELVRSFVGKKLFAEAYVIWRAGVRGGGAAGPGAIENAGFEAEVDPEEVGFGWRLALKNERARAGIAAPARAADTAGLVLKFNGNSEPGQPLASQLVVVEPGGSYSLRFRYRTEDLVTGGPPVVSVTDAADGRLLAKTAPLGAGGSGEGWSEISLQFNASRSGALLINISRGGCPSSPCPAYGRAFFDDFELRKIKAPAPTST